MNKSFNDAYVVIENMAKYHHQWGSERAPI